MSCGAQEEPGRPKVGLEGLSAQQQNLVREVLYSCSKLAEACVLLLLMMITFCVAVMHSTGNWTEIGDILKRGASNAIMD